MIKMKAIDLKINNKEFKNLFHKIKIQKFNYYYQNIRIILLIIDIIY